VGKPTKIMKLIKSFVAAMAGLAFSAVVSHAQLSLDFSSSPSSTIQFNGTNSTFQFNNSTSLGFGGYFFGSQWFIGNETGGDGSALNLLGLVNNSPFSYGPITTNISGPNIDETANVLGPLGALKISDGVGYYLTGAVDWVQVATHNAAGDIGNASAALTINVTGLAYAGTNVDLLTMAAEGPGSMDLTFQFSPGKTLGDLTSGIGPYKTSYSGSLSVPEPASVGLFLSGLGVLACSRRFIRNRRS
jgi:PEP-CTERM motif